MKKKYILLGAVILAAVDFFVWQEVFLLDGDQKLEVVFLDVGQGDSAFIKTPQGHQIMIDSGPGEKSLEKLAYLMPFWDKRLDLVILSHPEKDHMQGFLYILQRYKSDYILWNGIKKESSEYSAWIDVLEKRQKAGSKIITADKNTSIKAGNLLIDILAPLENVKGREIKSSSNDTGVVAKLIYGKTSFLFSADIDSSEENKIFKSGQDISADVLKIAHHGSKYSTSELFLAAVSPGVAVIEVGKNSYGHPTEEVLKRLENFGIKIKRTDKDGDINLTSNGYTISGF